jgi:hypothetical protein
MTTATRAQFRPLILEPGGRATDETGSVLFTGMLKSHKQTKQTTSTQTQTHKQTSLRQSLDRLKLFPVIIFDWSYMCKIKVKIRKSDIKSQIIATST